MHKNRCSINFLTYFYLCVFITAFSILVCLVSRLCNKLIKFLPSIHIPTLYPSRPYMSNIYQFHLCGMQVCFYRRSQCLHISNRCVRVWWPAVNNLGDVVMLWKRYGVSKCLSINILQHWLDPNKPIRKQLKSR